MSSPNLPSLPVQPLLEEGGAAPAWWEAWRKLPGVLDLYTFSDLEGLTTSLNERVIAPAEQRVKSAGGVRRDACTEEYIEMNGKLKKVPGVQSLLASTLPVRNRRRRTCGHRPRHDTAP